MDVQTVCMFRRFSYPSNCLTCCAARLTERATSFGDRSAGCEAPACWRGRERHSHTVSRFRAVALRPVSQKHVKYGTATAQLLASVPLEHG